MKILPVLDIRGGIVVRAVAGRRSEYRPLKSRLTDSVDPFDVANAIRDHFGWSEFYLADLDAIENGEPQFDQLKKLNENKLSLWVDAGVRIVEDAERIADFSVNQVVVGLETVAGPEAWQAMVRRLGPHRLTFSLDLRDGLPITDHSAWPESAFGIIEQIVADGCERLIILDLHRVGLGKGTGTDALCADVVGRHPGLEVYAGGGVRGWDDVRRLEDTGVTGVLIASAVHDGALSTEAIRRLS